MWYTILQNIANLFKWWITVAPWEQAIRVRAGKHITILQSGIFLKIPYLDNVHLKSVRRRITTTSPQTVTTLDKHVITLAGSIGYEITDLLKLYNTLENPQCTIEAMIQALISEFVACRNLLDCTPQAIEAHVTSNIRLSEFGLGKQEFYLVNYVSVKTYRILMGDLQYSNSAGDMGTLNTTIRSTLGYY